ncbi:iron-sulfur cluster assembly accessory protein [Geminocystis sp. NIES-3709]|uniref:HesB/IscA family protein n=1 Tax=Geminocystis sp. NIES-3709 TaxID=1617448 RepID=UPI0005FCB9EA|nr:iron-sulfur cluster assembly accessory protein [Geminocystis sp. NIES-3709]BAQ66220.1 probable iron binding protein from the HesB_IscA_SufA family [Geminocystis sp. NIES-3709]
MITCTETAIAEIKRLRCQRHSVRSQTVSLTSKNTTEDSILDTSNSYIRIKIEKGGCADYVYQLTFDTKSQPEDHQLSPDSDVTIIVDRDSYQYLQNLKIDYTEDLMGGAFQFKNIDIRDHCTCGLSFALPTEIDNLTIHKK